MMFCLHITGQPQGATGLMFMCFCIWYYDKLQIKGLRFPKLITTDILNALVT